MVQKKYEIFGELGMFPCKPPILIINSKKTIIQKKSLDIQNRNETPLGSLVRIEQTTLPY
uniref:Uncharacterized protein n=1 Tax=Meloidogyne incognita TaxID=6306 RepID=A0A914LIS3_MELIC